MKELTRGQIDRMMTNLFETVSFDGPVDPSEEDDDPLTESAFDPALHPRAAAGTSAGGQFVARATQSNDTPNELPSVPGSRKADPVARLAFTRMRNFLLRRGFMVPAMDVYTATPRQLRSIGVPGGESHAVAVDGGIVISSDLIGMVRALEKGARTHTKLMNVDNFSPDTAKMLIHEMLHHTRGVAAYNAAHNSPEELQAWMDARSTEEAIVEAVAVDETMAWVKRFPWRNGMSVGIAADYRDGVAYIRTLSERVTGKNWTSPQAQVWRRQLLMADITGRKAMIATAEGAQ